MNKYSSIFSQLLSLFPRLEFERLVKLTGTEYAAKGFQLGTLCGHAFLSTRASPFSTGDLQRPSQLFREDPAFRNRPISETIHFGLGQRAPVGGAIPEGFPCPIDPMPG